MKYKFNKSKIVVLGATGFVGSWLSLYLQQTKHNFIALGLKEEKNLFHEKIKKKVKFKYLDIKNQKKLFLTLDQFKPNLIINLASHSLVHFCNHNPYEAIHNNTIVTLNILEYIRKHKEIKLINFTSDKVYQNTNKKHNEVSPMSSNTIYGTSKILSDQLCTNYKNLYNLKMINFRCGNLYGGGDFNPNRFFYDIFDNYYKKKLLKIRSPNSRRPWTFALELIKFLIIFSENFYENKLKLNYDGINFSSNYKNYSIQEILDKLSKKIHINWIHVDNHVNEDLYLNIDSSYIRTYLKYSNQFNFNDTIEDTIKWYDTYYNNGNVYKESINQINKIINE